MGSLEIDLLETKVTVVCLVTSMEAPAPPFYSRGGAVRRPARVRRRGRARAGRRVCRRGLTRAARTYESQARARAPALREGCLAVCSVHAPCLSDARGDRGPTGCSGSPRAFLQ